MIFCPLDRHHRRWEEPLIPKVDLKMDMCSTDHGGVYEADVRYQKFSRLCKPSSEAVQKNCWQSRWGSVPESGANHPVLWSAFVKTVFIKRKIFESINRNLEIHNTLLAGPSNCFAGKKRRNIASLPVWLTNVVWRLFFKHRAASCPASHIPSTGQRTLPRTAGGTPRWGGGMLQSRKLCEEPLGSTVNHFMQKIS